MENQLFRKKSLERISSPEEMHNYMRVTSPRLWMILTAIVLLLGGFIAYASTTTLENTIPIKVQLESYEIVSENPEENEKYTYVYAYLPMSLKENLSTGMTVRLGKETGKISYFGATAEEPDALFTSIDMEHSYIPMPDAEYEAELVLESTTPISFLWNN